MTFNPLFRGHKDKSVQTVIPVAGKNHKRAPVLTTEEQEAYQQALSEYQTPIRFGAELFGLAPEVMKIDQDSD